MYVSHLVDLKYYLFPKETMDASQSMNDALKRRHTVWTSRPASDKLC